MPKLTTLIKTDDFSSVFSFKRRMHADFLVLHYRPNSLAKPRVGLAVSKKVASLAVHRNYMRRVLRELSRQTLELPAPVDFVIQVKRRFGHKDFLVIKAELQMLFARIQAKLDVQ